MSFTFDPTKQECQYYVGTTKVGDATKVCPKGIGGGYEELPGYPMTPGHYGHEYGPCLGEGPKSQRPDPQGSLINGDQQVLELPRGKHGSKGEFEKPYLELR